MESAIVIAAEVTQGTGALAGESITTATLREESTGRERVVRVVGGPYTRLAGYVVPVRGARVRVDLREDDDRRVSFAPLFSSTAWVANTPAGIWDTAKLPVSFALAPPRSRDLGASAAGELDVATRTWGRAPCTSFRARSLGEDASLTNPAADDGVNGVYFHDTSWPSELVAGALAQTIVHVDGSGKLHDTDIHINGAEYRFSTDGAAGTQDIRSILTHEIGHALGLGHSSDARATMNASGSGLRWRSLEKDDVDGVCALYPGTGTRGCAAPSTAGGEGPCPADFVCVAASCQRRGDRLDVCAPCSPDVASPCESAGDDARCVDVAAGAAPATVLGRACGRACARDSDCGEPAEGFACRATTEAGDLQCVSLRGCKNGASVSCATDAACLAYGIGSVCADGVCLGAAPKGGGSDGGVADGGTEGGPLDAPVGAGGSDCALSPRPSSGAGAASAAAVSAALLLLRRRRR